MAAAIGDDCWTRGRRDEIDQALALPGTSVGGPKQRPTGIPDRLALLAAMGRHEQTRTLLATYEAEAGDQSTEGRAGSADRRFVRQLTRWLERGSPRRRPSKRRWAS